MLWTQDALASKPAMNNLKNYSPKEETVLHKMQTEDRPKMMVEEFLESDHHDLGIRG